MLIVSTGDAGKFSWLRPACAETCAHNKRRTGEPDGEVLKQEDY